MWSRVGVARGVEAATGRACGVCVNIPAAAVAAAHSVDPGRWRRSFSQVIDRIAPRFARYEPLRHAASLVQGLLSGLEKKNCWTIAEHAGRASPDGLQHLLSRARWDADAVRDDLRSFVVDHFADPGAVLVVDETGDVKKGIHSVGVQRQYTGTAGRVENAQVAVFLTYAAAPGHAFIDRALYLPKSWTAESDRCAAAGIPAGTDFATKPALATAMIARAVTAGVPAAWVAGDEVYGADPVLRASVRDLGLGYVSPGRGEPAGVSDAGADPGRHQPGPANPHRRPTRPRPKLRLPGQMTYDLRRLRLHGLIDRVPHTHRYQVTNDGLRNAMILTRVHDR